MNSSPFLKIAASSLVIGASLAAWGPSAQSAQRVMAADQVQLAAKAARYANDAAAMLASVKDSRAKAYVKAEKAVALMPNNASYRVLLGRAYVAAGRFTSAETSFADALTLSPGDGRVALNLALMKIARGDTGSAMELLDAHRELIAKADFGLAQALAGDIPTAIETLQAAAREPDADAKTRQNLGLAYALAGRWIEARVVASQDLSPDLVDVRMGEWAQLASPRAAWDQVAGLLRVNPVADRGLPAQLALVVTGTGLASAEPANSTTVVAAAEPVAEPAFSPAPAPEAPAIEPSPVFETKVAYQPPAASRSVSIALDEPTPAPAVAAPAPLIRADASPLKQAVVAASSPTTSNYVPAVTRAFSSGRFVVQLGAYSNLSRAESAWDRVSSRVGELRNYGPTSARVKVKGNAIHRLSVSGFVTREAANQVCTQVRKAGGQCFVRSVNGLDAPMQFVSRGGSTRIAARR
jgi:Flp pilus assembly protein TadD/cell division septation protein DedD